MSQRAENNYRLELYEEMDDIITAMRNLARVEMLRLEKAQGHQRSVFDSCRQAMDQFLFHRGGAAAGQLPAAPGPDLLLVLGSERGFCGGFNELVVQRFHELALQDTEIILAVGTRLADKLSTYDNVIALRAAAGIDESLAVMHSIVDTSVRTGFPRRIRVLYHDHNQPEIVQLLPLPQPDHCNAASLCTTLPAATLLQELQLHYLQQGLMHYLTVSLHTENLWRLRQMEGARDHLEELSRNLRQRINAQRQQQIVEEIEVILSDQTFS